MLEQEGSPIEEEGTGEGVAGEGSVEEVNGGADRAKKTGKNKKDAIRKRNVYLTEDAAEEVVEQAIRLDRSPSWILLRAWMLAAPKLRRMPTEPDHRKPR